MRLRELAWGIRIMQTIDCGTEREGPGFPSIVARPHGRSNRGELYPRARHRAEEGGR